MNSKIAVVAGLSFGAGVLSLGIGSCAFAYFRQENQPPQECKNSINYFGGGSFSHGCPKQAKEKDNFSPIPEPLVNRIQNAGWQILEVCAGDGKNLEKLREAEVDAIGFDLRTSEHVKYGLSGMVEAEHFERTLMIVCGFESKKSVEAYSKAGGKRVILGGYAVKESKIQKDVYLIQDMTNPCLILKETRSEDANSSGNPYDGVKRRLEIRPDPDYMQDLGFSFEEVYLGPHPSGNPTNDSILCYYQIWEKDSQ